MANETYDNKPLSILNDGSVESALQLTSNIGNKVDADQELLDMDNLSLSSPTKYLATYSNPKDWILDESEAKSAQLLRAGMYPEQSSEVGSLAYSAGEMLRKTENIGRSFLGFAKGVDAYFAPNADKEQAWRAYNDFQKYAVQQEQNRAEYVEGRGVDPDVYGIGTNVMEVARDIVLTGGLAALSRRGAAKAAYKRASQYAAPEVAERFAIQKGKQAATRAATGSIVGSTFVREAGDRATEQAAKYMELTGDYDLKYYDPTLDFALNTGVSALNSVVEASLGVERIVPDMLFGRRGVGTVATEALKNYLGERSEEFIQNVLGQGADVLSGYADNIDFLDAWTESGVAGIIGAAFGTLSSGGMYYLNRRRMIRQLQETGMPPQTAREVTDKFLRNGINNTLQNLSSAVELKTQEGQAWEKLVNGVKTAMGTVDFATDTERTAQATAWAKTNTNVAMKMAFSSGLTIDEFLDVAEFQTMNNGQNLNMVFLKPLGSVQDIDDRIKEQDEIINRQNELRKTGADDKDAMRLAKQRKAILQKAKAIKQYNDAQYKAQIKAQTTPETAKEIETATNDVESVKGVTQAEFDSKVDTENLTSAEKSKRYGNAVIKSILPTKTDFDAVMVDPMYANAKQAIIAVADRINSFIKAHRTYGLKTDIANALKKMQTVNQGNFIDSVTTPDLDGVDVVAENAFLYHFLFSDATTIQTYLDSYITRAEESLNSKNKLSKKDLVGQAFKATDNAMQTQAQVIGAEYTSIYNEDGSYADKNVMAVMLSYQNQFVQEQPKVQTIEYSDSEVLGIFAKAKNNGDITLDNWENVRWSSLLSAGDTYQKGKRNKPATEAEKAKFARKMLDKYLPGWNQVSEPQQLTLFQEQFDLADENASLDDIYPEYKGKTIVVDGIKRSVFNSDGQRINKSAEALTNFWRWFGNSKAVDKKGRPLVVYHGARGKTDITEFDPKKGWKVDATYFATNPSAAAHWAVAGYETKRVLDLDSFVEKIKSIDSVDKLLDYYKIFRPEAHLAEEYNKSANENWWWFHNTKYDVGDSLGVKIDDSKYVIKGDWGERVTDLVDRLQKDIIYYAKGAVESDLYGVYVKLENPLIVDAKKESYHNILFDGDRVNTETIVDYAQANNYDGVIVKNVYETDFESALTDDVIAFNSTQIKSVDNRGTYSPDTGNIYMQGRKANGFYDPELGVIVLGRNMNEMTLPHEMQHYWLDKIFSIYKRAKSGELKVRDEWMTETKALFDMLGIDENQTQLTQGQQEKFARMSEAYLTGIGVTGDMNATFKEYQQWVPEKYKSILNLGYLSDDGKIEYPFLDQGAVDFFNKWYANYSLPSLATSPERQEFINPEDENGEVLPVSIKEMNNRDKEFGNDAEEQVKTDQRLYNTLDENMPAEIKIEADGQKVVQASRSNFLKESEKQQRRWYERKSRDAEAQLAQDYIEKNPEHAKEVIFGDPELIPNDTGIDRATLINAYMALNNITPESEDWATLHTNIAINQSLAGTQLALSNNTSYRTYLDALREIENAREMKAATNYAGAKQGAVERFNRDIQRFVDEELPKVLATAPNTEARDIALKSLFERARTKFSGNTTGGVLNQMDFDYARGQKGASAAFTRWAVNQIKKDAGAKLNGQEQAHLLNLSAKAQQAVIDLDDRDVGKAVAGAQEIRKWQVEKDKIMGVKPQKFSLFGDYAPRAMLASFNTLVVSNIPSTAMNTGVVRILESGIFGKNEVSKSLTDSEIKRIKAIYGATAMNLAQMEKPTSPSLLHGEKYSSSGQKWYDPFTILGKEDNWFRVPTFVNTLARIATQDAKTTGKSADDVFKEYCRLENQSDAAKLARKQALAVSNMAVFTQDGALARSLNGIRDWINQGSRALIGLDPKGFGLGNLLSPFLKTGANIAEMGIRGSLAPITSISALVQKWRSGKAIDPMKKLALAMDWTYFLLSSVMVSLLAALTSDDDEFYSEPYEMGKLYDPDKPYDSINIAGVWIDLDFFGPFAIPIRTGCRLVKQWKTDNLSAIYKGYGKGLKYAAMDTPLLESVFNNQMSYAAKKPEDWATGYVYNQVNKLVPSQVKPLSRAISRGTGTQLDMGWSGKVIERKFHRNYGFDAQELTTQDLIDIFTTKITWQP
jgi:hypothetical protein